MKIKIFKITSQKAKKISKNALVIVLVFLVGLGGGLVGSEIFKDRSTSLDKQSTLKVVTSQSELISSIAQDVSPSVVSINFSSTSSVGGLESYFGYSNQIQQGAGTGIIISSDGIVITNRHVIPDNTTNLQITTNDGKTYDDVELLAKDPRTNFDVAFLKINGVNDLKPAVIGDSSQAQVGDGVVAIGYALGEYQNTVTTGIISGIGRPVVASDGTGSAESLNDLFQTDAAINEGNSGGPLLNMSGEVIGINTAIASNAQNIGFAIPINDVKPQIDSILSEGKLQVPYLGVRYIMLDESIKDRFDLASSQGAWLKSTNASQSVINDSPADKAGLKEGDIITKINNQEINEDNQLAEVVSEYKVGDKISITYLRDGETFAGEATLEATSTN
jgi:serine protease Do